LVVAPRKPHGVFSVCVRSGFRLCPVCDGRFRLYGVWVERAQATSSSKKSVHHLFPDINHEPLASAHHVRPRLLRRAVLIARWRENSQPCRPRLEMQAPKANSFVAKRDC
jgi:hypothetical protein